MADNAVDPDVVSKNGIAEKKNAKIINEGCDDDDINLISHSPHYLLSCLSTNLLNEDKSFTVLS